MHFSTNMSTTLSLFWSYSFFNVSKSMPWVPDWDAFSMLSLIYMECLNKMETYFLELLIKIILLGLSVGFKIDFSLFLDVFHLLVFSFKGFFDYLVYVSFSFKQCLDIKIHFNFTLIITDKLTWKWKVIVNQREARLLFSIEVI